MSGLLRLAPDIPPQLARALKGRSLEDLWAAAPGLSGGRGTVRSLTLAGTKIVVKREARGGWAGRLLPDLYLASGAFDREWELTMRLAREDLCARPVAQELLRRGPLLRVFQATEAVENGLSLRQLWAEGRAEEEHFLRAGRAVGRLHRAGVLHGDLNAGNLVLPPESRVRFLDLRHSSTHAKAPSPAERRRNLTRLARSLHKLHHVQGLAWPVNPWRHLASGYAEGWGERERWLEGWQEEAARGFRLRSILWRPRGGNEA